MALQTSSTAESNNTWLAIYFGGCCASGREASEDEGRDALRAKGETEMQICYDQPQTVPGPRAESAHQRPSTSHSMSRHVSQWVANSRDFATRASSRASIHTLSRPRISHSKPRPSIGRPTDFRHYDGLDGVDGIQSMLDDAPMPIRRRRSFQPLELSIYLPEGRLSPLPDFLASEWDMLPALEVPALALIRDHDTRTNSIASNVSTSSYLIQRKAVGSGSRRSSVQSLSSLRSRPLSGALSTLPYLQEESQSRPDSIVSTVPSLTRSSTHNSLSSTTRMLSRLPSPSRSRSNTSNAPPSLRRAKTDIDEAIRELNTIVEERRADAYRSTNQSPALTNRPPPSPSHHVPAIAPSLRMRVRSETLSDIGSAFSVPLTNKSLPTPPHSRTPTRLHLSPPARTYVGPLTSNPITPPTPTVPTPTSPMHRLGVWLKRSLPATPSSPSFFRSTPSTPKPQAPTSAGTTAASPVVPFYQCTPARPSSSNSSAKTLTPHHARQDSAETATVTLFTTSSAPTTPALSVRSLSPTHDQTPHADSPPTPATAKTDHALLKRVRKVPAPLVLEKELSIEMAPPSARSLRSPNFEVLRGMEIPVKNEMMGAREHMSVGGVGVAF